MSSRIATIVAAGLVAATIAIGWWLATGSVAVPVAGSSRAAERIDAATSPAAEPADTPADAPVRESADARSDARAEATEAHSPFDLRGTFVVVDDNGTEHAAESGSIDVEVDGCLSGFDVKSGSWRLPDFTSRSRLRVVEARLGRKPVVCDIDIAIEPSNPPLQLRGHWLAPVRLRVIGSDTGADLANVRVVEPEFRHRLHGWRHPGGSYETEPSVVAATPILVWPPPGSVHEYLVGAPGYTWAHIEVDPTITAERWVRLDRGGDVDIAIEGRWPHGTTVRLSRDEGGAPLAEWTPDADGLTRLEAIPGGSWRVAVALGLWFQQPLVLGRGSVEVTPDAIATVTIALRSDEVQPPYASCAGTLVYPSAWRTPPRIDIEPTGATRPWSDTRWLDPERVANGSDEYRWSAGRVVAGTYQVRVTGSGFLTRFELPTTGDQNVRIVVPEPCEIRLRVLDSDTGKVFPIESERGWPPFWELDCREWEGSNSPEHLVLCPDGSYVGQTPPGAIWIYVHADGYRPSHTRHEIARGTNDVDIRVAHDCGVAIRLQDGDATVPWPDEVTATLHGANGTLGNDYQLHNRVAAKAPGDFTVTLTDVPGFEPIEPRSVTVSNCAWTEVAIPLRRKR